MDRRRALWLLALAVAAPLAGCGTYTNFTPINSPPHELTSRPSSRVQVFASGRPRRPYVDVAVIQVEQTHGLNEQGAQLMIDSIRAQAAALGCDAVVLGGITDHAGARSGSALALLDPGSTKQTAACIVYEDKEDVRSFRRTKARARAADGEEEQQREDPAKPVHSGPAMQEEDAENP
jgi:hypothetical protein